MSVKIKTNGDLKKKILYLTCNDYNSCCVCFTTNLVHFTLQLIIQQIPEPQHNFANINAGSFLTN